MFQDDTKQCEKHHPVQCSTSMQSTHTFMRGPHAPFAQKLHSRISQLGSQPNSKETGVKHMSKRTDCKPKLAKFEKRALGTGLSISGEKLMQLKRFTHFV